MYKVNKLPPEFSSFTHLIDQFDPLQLILPYYLCLLMVEHGKMQLSGVSLGKNEIICTFETTVGDKLIVVKPPISKEVEADVLEELRGILDKHF